MLTFLTALQESLAEADRRREVGRYEALAAIALAPVGQVWPEDATVADGTPDEVEAMLDFWEGRLADVP